MEKIKKFIKNPWILFSYLSHLGLTKWVPDKTYISILFKAKFGFWPKLERPVTYNEKLQWIKLHDRKEIYSTMVDKADVKKYVANRIGEEHIIETLLVCNNFDEIDIDKLPDQFVIKCTHDSGGVFICKDKNTFDFETVRKKINKSLKTNYYYSGREWPYKNVKPRIIIEKYMVDESGTDLRDYKVLVFEGIPKLIEFHSGRFTENQTQVFYDTNWNKQSISQVGSGIHLMSKEVAPQPENLEEMLRLSAKLAKDVHHLRVDWYSINGKLYFGELTFFDGSGFEPFDNFEDDIMLGSWIKL